MKPCCDRKEAWTRFSALMGACLLASGCYEDGEISTVDLFLLRNDPAFTTEQYGIDVYYDTEPTSAPLTPADYDYAWEQTQLCKSIFNEVPPRVIITDDLSKFCGEKNQAFARFCGDSRVILLRSDQTYVFRFSHESIHYLLESLGLIAESQNHDPQYFGEYCQFIFDFPIGP